MSEARIVRGGSCDAILTETPDTPVERRERCPNCGSTNRKFEITIKVTQEVRAALTTVIAGGPNRVALAAGGRALDEGESASETVTWRLSAATYTALYRLIAGAIEVSVAGHLLTRYFLGRAYFVMDD